MRWRAVALVVAVGLMATGCGGGRADDQTGGQGEAVVQAADGDSRADTSAAGGVAGDGESSAATPAAGFECTLTADDIGFDLHFRNDGPEAASYRGEVDLMESGTIVGSYEVSIPYVAPGEVVREYFFTGFPADTPLTSCTADRVDRVVEPVPQLALGDVGPCENLRPGRYGDFAYELTVTNRSATVSAGYTVRTVIRNPAGERRESRIKVFGADDDSGQGELGPGQSRTATDETLGPDFDEDYTCEVISVDKYSEAEFFGTATSGAPTGSLSADVGFATGSAELTDDARVLLAKPIEQIVGSADPVCVEGFADSVGDDATNLSLSQARADAVAELIREAGATNEIEAIGRGEAGATADEVDDPTRRRVDITLDLCPA